MLNSIKKGLLISGLMFVLGLIAFPANAQLSRTLKNVGKTVEKVAGDVAGDIAANKATAKIVAFMDQNNTISEEGTTKLNAIVGKYTSVDGLALNYKVYESAEANIMALADGSIRVYSATMELFNEDELLALIANQIGHIANNDVRDALLKVASEDNASDATNAQLEKMLSFSGDKLGSVINELIQIPYTDTQSKAADKFAFDLLKKNGNKTEALHSALEKLAEMEAADKAALAENELADVSPIAKFTKVNTNSSSRASLVASM